MNIAIASDHRGYKLKETITQQLRELDHGVLDHGCHEAKSCDYPDHAKPAAKAVAEKSCDRAILICGTGIGMSISANRQKGVRAALCHDEVSATASRHHNNANVLCLGADLIDEKLAKAIVNTWLNAEFEGDRHQRRIEKIDE